MRRLLWVVLLALGLSDLTAAASDSPEAQLKAFQQAANAYWSKPIATSSSSASDRRTEASAYLAPTLAQLSIDRTPPQDFERVVTAVIAATQNDSTVLKAADALMESYRAARKKRLADERAEFDALLKKAGDACLAARTPSDLDVAIESLSSYARNSASDRPTQDLEIAQRGARAYIFVTRWQDYIDLRNQGQSREATKAMRELSSLLDPSLMPRSRILALLKTTTDSESPPSSSSEPSSNSTNVAANAPAPTRENLVSTVSNRLEKAKTLADLISVAAALREARGQFPAQINPLIESLATNINDRQQVLAGNLPVNVFDPLSSATYFNAENIAFTQASLDALIAFRRETQFEALHVALNVTLPDAKTGDTLDTFTICVVDKFAAANNWAKVRDTLEIYRTFFGRNIPAPTWIESDISSLTAYLTARNLDLAGQYPSAIASYQRAVRTVGRYVPVKAIGARLAELEKTHPAPLDEAGLDGPLPAEVQPGASVINAPSENLPSTYMQRIKGDKPRKPAPSGPSVENPSIAPTPVTP